MALEKWYSQHDAYHSRTLVTLVMIDYITTLFSVANSGREQTCRYAWLGSSHAGTMVDIITDE